VPTSTDLPRTRTETRLIRTCSRVEYSTAQQLNSALMNMLNWSSASFSLSWSVFPCTTPALPLQLASKRLPSQLKPPCSGRRRSEWGYVRLVAPAAIGRSRAGRRGANDSPPCDMHGDLLQ